MEPETETLGMSDSINENTDFLLQSDNLDCSDMDLELLLTSDILSLSFENNSVSDSILTPDVIECCRNVDDVMNTSYESTIESQLIGEEQIYHDVTGTSQDSQIIEEQRSQYEILINCGYSPSVVRYTLKTINTTINTGYRKNFNCQVALVSMIEKWKMARDKGENAGGVLMDLSKAFDTINHELLIAKLHAYGFGIDALKIIHSYLSDRWTRTKIDGSYSTWKEILSGMPQGSVNGPKWFNIYINDLFFLFINTEVCNIADDSTPYACNANLRLLLQHLESDVASAIMWFDANYMKLNQSKCHFLISTNSPEHLWIQVGEQVIWESLYKKLLGVTIDNDLKFTQHIQDICKKAGAKVTALARMIKIVTMDQKKH